MSVSEKKVLAADLGASSGRVMLCGFDGEKISIRELHRFSNDPVVLGGTMYWDFLRLFHEIKQGILKAKQQGGADSISVDTWGVDFGLLDAEGYLLENPVHYRDSRTQGMLEKSFALMDREKFYQITGNQFMEINTAFQLLYLSTKRPALLERADSLLLMPDLFHYFLCGEKCSEYSIASTTQLLDAKEKVWSSEVLSALGLPDKLLQPLVQSGTMLSDLRTEITQELGVSSLQVIASAGHDTQCALAAVPTQEKDFIFISCGTWSLFGTELDSPIINEKSARLNITNEGGVEGRISFLKNIIGLWLVQESRRQWMREGKEYSFGELESLAGKEEAFRSLIDPDAPEFTPSGNLPERIRQFCRRTGQPEPLTPGQVVRCINESLALKYRLTLEEIRECTGRDYPVIHMVGGGTQSALLCQFTANACARPVCAGPVEATVYGNAAIQLMAAGQIGSLTELRKVVAASEPIRRFEPENAAKWEEMYEEYKEKVKQWEKLEVAGK
ncbi:MAG TPA: rhamnulokinase [Candidatus Eisenbergiella merdipullorum]|uniref:Rhamnulokinase n=1 Tax=Candidatus Eisenbergiella merdipullorum TaxID=2838553 RepID=A0A9D2I595_9FIRM|nr:rhamnulokinase [Candidatus Eisenbergiella merdipullorum]